MEENVSLLDKRMDDLTLRDSLKINLVVVTALVAAPIVIAGAVTAVEKIREKRAQRKQTDPDLTVAK